MATRTAFPVRGVVRRRRNLYAYSFRFSLTGIFACQPKDAHQNFVRGNRTRRPTCRPCLPGRRDRFSRPGNSDDTPDWKVGACSHGLKHICFSGGASYWAKKLKTPNVGQISTFLQVYKIFYAITRFRYLNVSVEFYAVQNYRRWAVSDLVT